MEYARDADELSVTVESKLFGSNDYRTECPFYEFGWSVGYDRR